MKLTILGTGNATVSECYNTCYAISDEGKHFLVDAGGGNRILKVLKDTGIDMNDIHDIFVTHEHVDHVLGIIWLVRMIGQRMNQGKYEGDLRIYCHEELAEKIQAIANMTIQQKVCKHMGERIQFDVVKDGDSRTILGCPVTFFDIGSTKAKQFGFTMQLKSGKKFTCVGDEPYNEVDYKYVKGSDWLLHEAFCLFGEADKFKPYEKHHSTVKEACQLAEELGVPNLLLYHTEETHLAERKKLYTEEGQQYYHGNLYVPDDLDSTTIDAHYSIGEIMEKAGLNTILGMGTVFVILIFISILISLFKYIPALEAKFKNKGKAESTQEAAPAPAAVAAPVVEEASNDDELAAVISAAIAAYEAEAGGSTDGFVVRSIKRRPSNKWHA